MQTRDPLAFCVAGGLPDIDEHDEVHGSGHENVVASSGRRSGACTAYEASRRNTPAEESA